MTREKARVDRIGPPGLIPRFVDPTAEFRYAPADPVVTVSQRERAIQFDGPEAGLDHRGEDEVEHVRSDTITWT
ncbi:MAG: chromate resistance protein, partial [Thermoplasmata archaeon]|nr:chromate resistance protein [Thermoplasmata archaeon]